MKSTKLRIALILMAGAMVTGLGYWTGFQQGKSSAKAEASAGVDKGAKKPANATRSTTASLGVNSKAGETLDQLLNATGRPDFGAINDWAKSLSLEQTAAAMTELQALPAGAARDNILRSLVNEWGAKDPKGLLAATDTITVPRLREGGITNALRTLASDNPKEALDWIKQNAADTSGADLARRYSAAIGGVASTDPAGALALAGNLSDATPADRAAKTRAMESVANAMAQQGKFTDAVALFAQMPAGQSQTDAMAQLANRWSQTAPLDAAAWVGSIQDPRLRSSVGQDLVSNWAGSDPVAAAKWAVEMDTQAAAAAAAGQGRGSANQSQTLLADAVSTWARYDINAAGQFINDLPASAMKNNAIASFATQAARDDPVSAVNWVNTITNPRAKATATQQVVLEVAQQDPRSARQILNSSTVLTDQQKQDLLTTIQTNQRSGQNNGGGGGGFGGGGGGRGPGGGGGGGGRNAGGG